MLRPLAVALLLGAAAAPAAADTLFTGIFDFESVSPACGDMERVGQTRSATFFPAQLQANQTVSRFAVWIDDHLGGVHEFRFNGPFVTTPGTINGDVSSINPNWGWHGTGTLTNLQVAPAGYSSTTRFVTVRATITNYGVDGCTISGRGRFVPVPHQHPVSSPARAFSRRAAP